MTLYEIKQKYLDAMNNLSVDEETGEILGIEELAAIEGEFDDKAENVALYIKNLVAEANAIKAEETNLKARRDRLAKRADRLERYLNDMMTDAGKDKLVSAKCEVKFTKGKRVEIDSSFIEWAMVHREDLLTYKSPEANKVAIKKAIGAGDEIPGAVIVETKSINIK